MEKSLTKTESLWRPILYMAAATLVIYLPLATFADADLGAIIYVLFAAFISLNLLGVLVVSKGRRQLSVLLVLAIFWTLSAVLVMNHAAVRDIARWSLWSSKYEAKVLAHPAAKPSELQHAEWDGWGWAGAYTDEYVVFDPTDSLAAAPRQGRLSGLPCEVYQVRRLESHWYTATFYTDTNWEHCAR